MAGLTLPDVGGLTDARGGILSAFEGISGALPADPSTLTAGLTGSTASLHASLSIDASGLTGGLSGALAALESAVPDGVPALDELATGLQQALGILDPLKLALTEGGTLQSLEQFALKRAGDPAQRIGEVLDGLAAAIPADGLEALTTFIGTVTSFGAAIPTDPAEVATFLGNGFLGVPSDLLDPARAALDGLLGAFTALVPQAQVGALPGLVAGIVAELGALDAHVKAIVPGDPASYALALGALGDVQTSLQAFATATGSLVSGVLSALPSIDLGALTAPIAAALAAVPDIDVPDTGAFVDIVLEPLRQVSLAADLATPEQVAAALDGLVGAMEQEFAGSGLVELEAIVRKPFEQVGHAIEGLHLEAIRAAFGDALGAVASTLTPVTGAIATVRTAIIGALDPVATAIGAITTVAADVQGALQDVASAVQAAAAAVSLEGFAQTANDLVAELSGSVTSFVQQAGAAVESLHGLVAELGEIDLEQAAAGAVDAIGRVTTTLSSIDITPLPDAAVAEVKDALNGLLGSISLEPVQATLSGAIDGVPFDALDALEGAVADALKTLEQFSPSGLLEPLVAPFAQISAKLTALHPAALLAPVIDELQSASTALDGLDPLKLLAPLDAPLAHVREGLEAFAPEKLLAPLHAPFAELMAFVDKLDVTPFLDKIDTLASELVEQALGGLSGLTKPLEASGSAGGLASALGAGAPIGGDFGLRPGDVLKPVQELYEKVTGLITQIPAETVVGAFEQIRSALVQTLDALSPGNLPAHVHAHVETLIAGFDVGARSDLLGDLLPSYGRLALSVDAIDPAAVGGASAEHAQLLTLTASVDPEAMLRPLRQTFNSVRHASVQVAGSLDVGPLTAHYATVATRLSALLPEFLRQPVTMQALLAHLDEANPKHIAEAVNAEFDALLAKIVRFAETFTTKLPALAGSLGGHMEHALSQMLRGAFAAVYEPLRAQLQSLDPAGLEQELEVEIFAPIRATLDSLSLAGIAGDAELTAKLAGARSALQGVLDGLRNVQTSVGGAFDGAVAGVLAVSPVTLQANLQTAYAPIAAGLASLDLGGISGKLHAEFERLGDQAPTVLQEVLDALKALIAAIPGGIEGVHAEVDLSVRA
jgi:hypothetical protein